MAGQISNQVLHTAAVFMDFFAITSLIANTSTFIGHIAGGDIARKRALVRSSPPHR